MPGVILRVSAPDEKGAMRVTVRLSGDEGEDSRRTYRLTAEQYDGCGAPDAKSAVSDETIAAFAVYEGQNAAVEKAVSILAFGDNSAMGLYRKLRRHGYDKETSESAVNRMLSLGYIREHDQAYRLVVLAAQSKKWGKRRIAASLSEKGYPAALSARVLREAEENGDVDFDEIRASLLATLPPEADYAERRKLLAKYGF